MARGGQLALPAQPAMTRRSALRPTPSFLLSGDSSLGSGTAWGQQSQGHQWVQDCRGLCRWRL